MSYIHNNKVSIIQIIEDLKKQTGVSYEQMRDRMCVYLGYEISRDRFDQLFRRKPEHLSTYNFLEITALVQSVLLEVPRQPCTVDQAVQLFDLTSMKFPKDFKILKEFFPLEEFQKAIERYKHQLDPDPSSDHPLQTLISRFGLLIREKTRGFVGRGWVFDRINQFINTHSHGYFLITGDPGIGKTALAAYYINNTNHPHYFNIRAEGNSKPETFLISICAQLIIRFNLNYLELPANVTQNSRFFVELLQQISDRLPVQEKCILVIDALDEVDEQYLIPGGNPLYLPAQLPERIFIVITRRRPEPNYHLRIECDFAELEIMADSKENQQDVRDYIQTQINTRYPLKIYADRYKLTSEAFVQHLLDKSEANFMYLYHVLPEIEQGYYAGMDLDRLPKGLTNYYEDHWLRMRIEAGSEWFEYKLPILVALSVAYEPMPLLLLEEYAQVQERYILSLLKEWDAFIHSDLYLYRISDEDNELHQIQLQRYRLYHETFFKFIHDKDQVANERINLSGMRQRFANLIMRDLFRS